MLNKKCTHTFTEAKQAILSKVRYHCWILGLALNSPKGGFELLKLKPNFPFCIVVSGAQSMESAAQAMKLGAFWVYDKHVFSGDPNAFIAKTCGLAALSFMLNGCNSKCQNMFTLLIDEFVATPEEWSRKYNRHQQTLRTICEETAGLNLKQFLYLFHSLNAVLILDCLGRSAAGDSNFHKSFMARWEYYCHCARYVLSQMTSKIAPLYLEK
jgi:hypothetical protein